MYLVDTNIWLERLLDQDRSEEVGLFLQRPGDRICLADFTLHSIGIVLMTVGESATFRGFVQDVLLDGAVQVVRLQPEEKCPENRDLVNDLPANESRTGPQRWSSLFRFLPQVEY